jgi:hypothetical protein
MAVPQFAILLIQVDDQDASRVWSEYPTYNKAIEDLMQMVEDVIKASNQQQQITYDLVEFLNYFDRLKEVVILKSHQSGMLEPISRDHIRKSIKKVFQKLVTL